MTETATVFVVDDDLAVLDSWKFLLESVGLRVETFESARVFLDQFTDDRPGCVVVDVRIPGMSGLELQQKMNERHYTIPIIVVTAFGDVPMAVRAMQSGAISFLEKPVSDQELLDYVQKAIALDAQQHESQARKRAIRTRYDSLTTREREVMKLVVAGLSSRKIAEDLKVSFKTIEAHRGKVMKKMGAVNIAQLVQMYLDGDLDK